MPTEIVASQAVPVGTATTILDAQVVIGVPAWVFVVTFLFFVFVGVFVWWLAKLRKLQAVAGWAESLKKQDIGDVQVWMISRTQKLIIGCMKIEDNILSYKDKTKIGMWHHNTRESVIRVGGNPAVVVSEDFDQTRDFISEIALTDNCDIFNQNQEELQTELLRQYEENKKNGMDVTAPKVLKPIENYLDYEAHGRTDLQVVNPEGLWIRSFNIFSNIRFLKYFPLGCSHMFFGGELLQDAKRLKRHTKEAGFWEKHALLAGAIIVVVLLNIVAWMIPLK